MKRNCTAILTINDASNYGNRLQNYALSKLLKKKYVAPQSKCGMQIL